MPHAAIVEPVGREVAPGLDGYEPTRLEGLVACAAERLGVPA